MVAAKFLKKSGLSDVVLSRVYIFFIKSNKSKNYNLFHSFDSQIWDLSDPTGRGYLDREGFFVALKLVALAQAGHDINMRNIFVESSNPPKVVSKNTYLVFFLDLICVLYSSFFFLIRVKYRKSFHQKFKRFSHTPKTGAFRRSIVSSTTSCSNHCYRSTDCCPAIRCEPF